MKTFLTGGNRAFSKGVDISPKRDLILGEREFDSCVIMSMEGEAVKEESMIYDPALMEIIRQRESDRRCRILRISAQPTESSLSKEYSR